MKFCKISWLYEFETSKMSRLLTYKLVNIFIIFAPAVVTSNVTLPQFICG